MFVRDFDDVSFCSSYSVGTIGNRFPDDEAFDGIDMFTFLLAQFKVRTGTRGGAVEVDEVAAIAGLRADFPSGGMFDDIATVSEL